MFTGCVNVVCGERTREEQFTTGRHVVSDIFCACCNSLLGWKYIVAFEATQKYKEGKFIMDKSSLARGGSPGDDEGVLGGGQLQRGRGGSVDDEEEEID